MRRRWTLALLVTGCLAWPAAARANAYTQVSQLYARTDTGQIPPCQFSSPVLEAALRQAPSYDYEYDTAFSDAIGAALAARADGDCTRSAAARPPTRGSVNPAAHLTSADLRLPRSITAAGSGGLPLVLVIAFALVGVLALMLATWLGFTSLGAEPRLVQSARHSLREAEHRIAAGWEDLSDRLRR